jgi:hypothetical protein
MMMEQIMSFSDGRAVCPSVRTLKASELVRTILSYDSQSRAPNNHDCE